MYTHPTSLIIINYNGADLLPACIESALPTLGPRDEIIVVDNASRDIQLVMVRCSREEPQ